MSSRCATSSGAASLRAVLCAPLLPALVALLGAALAAAGEPEPLPPQPVTDFVAAPAADAGSPEQAWARAQAREKAEGRKERDRLCAALPYYLAVAEFVNPDGARDQNAAAAAVRIAEIVEKYARNNDERLVAGKYYLAAAYLSLGSDAWERAEKLYFRAGRGRDLAAHLRRLSEHAAKVADSLADSADKDDQVKAAHLRAFSGLVAQRAEAAAVQAAPPSELGSLTAMEVPAPKPRVSGWTELRDNGFLREHPLVKADDVKRGLLHLEGQYPVDRFLLVVSGEAVGDYATGDQDGNVDLVEAYADAHFGGWDLRVGQQIFSWGTGVLFNPTDNVGRWNSTDPFDVQRRGVPAALVRYNLGATSLEGAAISGFEATRLPSPGQRFFIYYPATIPNPFYPGVGPPELRTNFTGEDFSEKPGGLFETEQYACRLRTTIGTWDIALSYFKGYENIPLITAQAVSLNPAAGTVDLAAQYLYPREQVYGLDLAGTVGKLGLHLEAARFEMDRTGVDVGAGDQDYTAYVAGCEYPFEDVISTHDLQVCVEYAGEIKDHKDNRIYINRIYQDSLLGRLKYTVDYRLAFELREFYNLGNGGARTYAAAEYRWSDYVGLTGGVDVFTGPANTFFGAYRDNCRAFLTLKVSF